MALEIELTTRSASVAIPLSPSCESNSGLKAPREVSSGTIFSNSRLICGASRVLSQLALGGIIQKTRMCRPQGVGFDDANNDRWQWCSEKENGRDL